MTTRNRRHTKSTPTPVVLSAIGFVFGITMLGLLAVLGAIVVA